MKVFKLFEDEKYLNEIVGSLNKKYKQHDSIDEAEKVMLVERYQAGDRAVGELLYYLNVRLMINRARHYAKKSNNEVLDLLDTGTVAFYEALDRFDASNKTKLSTYVQSCVDYAILETMNLNENIHFSKHYKTIHRKYYRFVEACVIKTGKKPEMQQAAAAIGYTEEQIVRALTLVDRYRTQSLDQPMNTTDDGDEFTGRDIIEDKKAINAVEYLAHKETIRELHQAINRLPEQTQLALSHKYGLDDNSQLSDRQIAQLLGITERQVKRLLSRAKYALQQRLSAEVY